MPVERAEFGAALSVLSTLSGLSLWGGVGIGLGGVGIRGGCVPAPGRCGPGQDAGRELFEVPVQALFQPVMRTAQCTEVTAARTPPFAVRNRMIQVTAPGWLVAAREPAGLIPGNDEVVQPVGGAVRRARLLVGAGTRRCRAFVSASSRFAASRAACQASRRISPRAPRTALNN